MLYNDRLVQKKTHVLHPLINALAVQDKEKIYLKMVNVDEEDREVRICTDCAVTQEVLAEVLAADPGAVNSFEDKEHVSAVCGEFREVQNLRTVSLAHSVNVIGYGKRREEEFMLRKVQVKNGVLQGLVGKDPRITVFRGVPYAKPPVGEAAAGGRRSPQKTGRA